MDKNSERISKDLRKQSEQLDWSMLTFPVVSSHNSIEKFEKVNDIGVNIFGYENGSKKEGIRQGVYPRRITKTRSSKMVDLLIISDDEKQHYCVINSMSKLLSSQMTKHQHKIWFCRYCPNGFNKQDSLNYHLEYCGNNEAARTIFAKENFTHFNNYYKSMRVPFTAYTDFECFTEKIDSVRPSEDSQYTMKYQRHKPSGFCLYIMSPFFEFEPIMYTKKSEDEDIGWIFFETLESEIRKVCDLIKYEKEMILTDDDKRKYKESIHCHICGKSEFTEKDWKVRDHCHISGKFRGAAHNTWNMRFRVPKFTPGVFP